MSLRFLDDPSRYKIPRVLYLVRWINSNDDIAKKCYLRKAAAVDYWQRRVIYTDSPCWIETFELSLIRSDFYKQNIPQSFSEAQR